MLEKFVPFITGFEIHLDQAEFVPANIGECIDMTGMIAGKSEGDYRSMKGVAHHRSEIHILRGAVQHGLLNAVAGHRQTEAALNYAEQTLVILNECAGKGPEFPLLDYFICYQVFTAGGEFRLARLALQSAYQGVIERAEKITDAALRQSFLEQVALNRDIVSAYQGNGIAAA